MIHAIFILGSLAELLQGSLHDLHTSSTIQYRDFTGAARISKMHRDDASAQVVEGRRAGVSGAVVIWLEGTSAN